MADQIEVSGLDDLRETLLKRLPEALQGKASQLALTKACRPIIESAKSKAPTRFVGPLRPGQRARGRLRDSIVSERSASSTKTNEVRSIGVTRRAWYWKFIEFGRGVVKLKRLKDKTRAKRIASGLETGERDVLGTPGVGFFGKEVKAFPAKPFLRPAFEENAGQVPIIYARELQPAIEKVAAKAQARSLRRIRKAITGF